MSEFRDSIAWMIGTLPADEVLAMPDMQSIKKALFDLTQPTQWKTVDGPKPLHVRNLRECGLPDSVIEWVLS